MTIKLVTEQEVKELETKLKVTDKTSKDYFQIEKNLNDARELLEHQNKIIKKARKKGYRPNSSDGDCMVTGERIKANCGFAKQGKYGGWEIYSWDIVREEIEG